MHLIGTASLELSHRCVLIRRDSIIWRITETALDLIISHFLKYFFIIVGCPWITLQGNKTQMTYEQYFTWMHGLNPFIKNTLGEEVKFWARLFKTNDAIS